MELWPQGRGAAERRAGRACAAGKRRRRAWAGEGGRCGLLPEVRNELAARGLDIPVMVAGSIADGRGVTAALALSASRVEMGMRLLASEEIDVGVGYRNEIVRARDGG